VLWRCWLGGRKASGLQKLSDEALAWLSLWSEVQMICIWSSWCHCHCHPIVSCSSKIQNGLPLWCWLTQVVLEKQPLNRCSVVVVNCQSDEVIRYFVLCWANVDAVGQANCMKWLLISSLHQKSIPRKTSQTDFVHVLSKLLLVLCCVIPLW